MILGSMFDGGRKVRGFITLMTETGPAQVRTASIDGIRENRRAGTKHTVLWLRTGGMLFVGETPEQVFAKMKEDAYAKAD